MSQYYGDSSPNTRQHVLDNLPLGESYSICQRLDLSFGLSDKAAHKVAEQLRGRIEQMIHRTRRKVPGRVFKTEVMYALPSSNGAIFVFAACTRTQ